MARPLRIEYPNACYHVMNRGNHRQEVFTINSDSPEMAKSKAAILGCYTDYCSDRNVRVTFTPSISHDIAISGQTLNSDYKIFIDTLAQFSTPFQVQIRAYCLMPNHFHLYVCTKEANLSKFMQSLMTSYAVTFNRRHFTNDHLFQGRFKALLIEDEGYGSEVSRYIHLNPAQVIKDKPVIQI